MFFRFKFFSGLIALALLSLVVSGKQGPSLEVSVIGSDIVNKSEDLVVTVKVANTGDETVRVLHDPRGPLSQLPADTFMIPDSNGNLPVFHGIKAKFVAEIALKVGAYTVLAPGQSVSVEHNLLDAYDFSNCSLGRMSIEVRSVFSVVDSQDNISRISARSTALVINVSAKLEVPRLTRSRLAKRAWFVGCDASQQDVITNAASAAQNYAAEVASYISSYTSSTPRYDQWFGLYTSTRYETVMDHFYKINNNTFASYTYDCTCSDSGTFAYVSPDDFGHVYLCGAFWQAPLIGTDSQGGTLIHEASHFTSNGGTDDIVYGQNACTLLAQVAPDEAITNADSHEYFVENNPSYS